MGGQDHLEELFRRARKMLGLDAFYLNGAILLTSGHFVIAHFMKASSDVFVRKRIMLKALGVICAMIAVKVAYEATLAPRNLYSLLEVQRFSSPLEIRSSYKSISRKLHPDKNPGADAEARFNEVKTAYDILMDEQQREIYNRFGEGDLSFDPRMDELKLIGTMGAVYLFWVVCVYFATMPKSSRVSRTWIAICGIAMLVVEVSLRLTESAIPSFMPGTVTENNLINLMHSLFPGVILLLRCVAEAHYVDVQGQSINALGKVIEQYEAINTMLDETLAALAGNNDDGDSEGKLQKLKQYISSSGEESRVALDKFKTASSDPAAGYYWLVVVGIYGCLYLASGGE